MGLNSLIGSPKSRTELTSALGTAVGVSLALGCLVGLQAQKTPETTMYSNAWEPVATERTRDRTPNSLGAHPRQHSMPDGSPAVSPNPSRHTTAANPSPKGSEQISH